MSNDAHVMRLWRECDLPEYFLGNGGTNDKLVALQHRIRAEALEEAAQVADAAERGTAPTIGVARAIRALKGRAA